MINSETTTFFIVEINMPLIENIACRIILEDQELTYF